MEELSRLLQICWLHHLGLFDRTHYGRGVRQGGLDFPCETRSVGFLVETNQHELQCRRQKDGEVRRRLLSSLLWAVRTTSRLGVTLFESDLYRWGKALQLEGRFRLLLGLLL